MGAQDSREELDQLLQLCVADLVQLQLLLNEHLLHVDHAIFGTLQICFVAERVDLQLDVVVSRDRGVVVRQRAGRVLAAHRASGSSCRVQGVVDLSFVAMVDDLLADLLGHVRDVIVVLLSNPIQEIEGVVLAQVPCLLYTSPSPRD